MIDPVARRQGQPVLFLLLLLTGWLLLRIVTWESPWSAAIVKPAVLSLTEAKSSRDAVASAGEQAGQVEDQRPSSLAGGPAMARAKPDPTSRPATAPSRGALDRGPDGSLATQPERRRQAIADAGATPMAAPVGKPGGRELAAEAPGPPRGGEALHPASSPWRFDGWLLLREGSIRPAASGASVAGYGGSQAGAILSYALAPDAPRAPAVFVRASRALGAGGETEGAFGLRARPFPRFPVAAHVEIRATDRSTGTELRPAAYVAGGFEPEPLVAGLRASGYAQAGYVGGRFATAFVDGRVTAVREVVRVATASIAAGGGVWGGAQQGAARLDVGPGLQIDFRLGDRPVRLAVDHRLRVAGNAAPRSSQVLTLSTGF